MSSIRAGYWRTLELYWCHGFPLLVFALCCVAGPVGFAGCARVVTISIPRTPSHALQRCDCFHSHLIHSVHSTWPFPNYTFALGWFSSSKPRAELIISVRSYYNHPIGYSRQRLRPDPKRSSNRLVLEFAQFVSSFILTHLPSWKRMRLGSTCTDSSYFSAK